MIASIAFNASHACKHQDAVRVPYSKPYEELENGSSGCGRIAHGAIMIDILKDHLRCAPRRKLAEIGNAALVAREAVT